MIHKSLIERVKQIFYDEVEIIWYLNEYENADEHPFEKYIRMLYLDLNIKLPSLLSDDSKQLLLGLPILIGKYDLHQDLLPGTYRLYSPVFGYLDKIKDVTLFEANLFDVIIHQYYQAKEDDEIGKIEDAFNNSVNEWNYSLYVKQEEVKALLDKHSLKETSRKANIPEQDIPRILDDYYSRINRKRIENLDHFLNKSNELLAANESLKDHTRFFAQIVEEVKNGGINLKSTSDIIPHYAGIKFN
jgi:hypothetical protein